MLAVASGGGHFVQLSRLFPALNGAEVTVVSTLPGYGDRLSRERPGWNYRLVADASRDEPLGLIHLAGQLARIVWRERPDVVISTGAAPGYLAVRIGKMAGARTMWLDSAANHQRLSLSGERAGRFADEWMTQWPHLAADAGPHFRGRVF